MNLIKQAAQRNYLTSHQVKSLLEEQWHGYKDALFPLIALVDLSAAFPSLDHSWLFWALRQMGIPIFFALP